MANTRGKRKETAPVDEVMEKTDTTTAPVKANRKGTVNCQNLNVRKAPAMGSTILKIIPKDTKVTILDSVNDAWYKVRVGEIETGFCMKEFINVPAK